MSRAAGTTQRPHFMAGEDLLICYTSPQGGAGFFAASEVVACEEGREELMKPCTFIRLKNGATVKAIESPQELLERMTTTA